VRGTVVGEALFEGGSRFRGRWVVASYSSARVARVLEVEEVGESKSRGWKVERRNSGKEGGEDKELREVVRGIGEVDMFE